MKKKAKKTAMGKAMHEIKKKGVRKNTHAPVSKSNPRRKVSHKQAVAIALSKTGQNKKKKGK
jgi:hypothetical protein